MKKHPFMQPEFHSSVKLSKAQEFKISKWLAMAGLVMEKLIRDENILHPSWTKEVTSIRVSILLCGEAKIKKLNSDYRNKDKVTDVLSFPSYENLRKTKPKSELIGSELFLGDLAICHQRVNKQAREFSISYWDEFIHLFMHGMIHLMGYDHELSVKEEKEMEGWENQALNLFSKIKKKGPN
jgi:probable rRNA maturation factor